MIVPGPLNGASEADADPTPMSVIPVDRGHTMTVPKSNQAQIKAVSGKRSLPPTSTTVEKLVGLLLWSCVCLSLCACVCVCVSESV